MDGLPTARSKMAAEIAGWANRPEQAELWAAHPVRGELGIVVVPDTQLMSYVQQGSSEQYAQAVWGVYRGFFDLNVQADYVHVDDIDAYEVLYLPVPTRLTVEVAGRLARWVEAGGTLISEGAPAYFGDRGTVSVVQPGAGLDAVFGAREATVEFTPDLLARGEDRFVMGENSVACGLFRQSYVPQGGAAVGFYDDGSTAVVEHRYGQGRTLLVGTAVGSGYAADDGRRGRQWFRSVLDWAAVDQHVRLSEPGVTARLHHGPSGLWLWVTNPSPEPRTVRGHVGPSWEPISKADVVWGSETVTVAGSRIDLTVGGRDAVVARLS
jgi:beta-galactosidase